MEELYFTVDKYDQVFSSIFKLSGNIVESQCGIFLNCDKDSDKSGEYKEVGYDQIWYSPSHKRYKELKTKYFSQENKYMIRRNDKGDIILVPILYNLNRFKCKNYIQ